MNMIAQAVINNQTFSVTEIGQGDQLLKQYWQTRTSIWTYKYPEVAGADGFERDQFDFNSSVLVLIEGVSQVIAGTRLIHADSVAGLPIASCARVQLPGKAVEVSRFFFTPTKGTNAQDVEQQFKLFIYGIVTYLKGQSYERAHATIRSSLFEKLRTLGVPLLRNGPDQLHGGKSFVPSMMFETDPNFVRVQDQPDRQRLTA